MSNSKKIRLGICMAGAVSAGAYTAGVMDYLIETLERWQQQKDNIEKKEEAGLDLTEDEKLVPRHDVIIEVLSGASAGGMTAAVLAYSFNDNSYYSKREGKLIESNYPYPLESDKPSKLYEAWINMVDDDKESSTFKKLMDTSDVVALNEMKSILNSRPIDEIAEKAIPKQINFQPPKYVSDFASIILSVTNLEGIPVDIRFSNINQDDPTCNVLKIHSGFLHYQFKGQKLFIDYPAEVVTEETKTHLAAAAKATGAFPFGLSNRKIIVKKQFFEEYKKRLKDSYKIDINLKLTDNEDYVFNAVDGGTINNEPIGTTVRILDCKKAAFHPDDENYLILIDPFPTVTNAKKRDNYCEPGDYTLIEQAKKLISAIRNQSMYRQEDLLNGLEMDANRFLLSPTKKKFYFLASGLIEGFGGFFKKEFRHHDYQLGRKNCQAFLRFYFGETRERFNKITDLELPDEQFEKWRYDVNFGKLNEQPSWKFPLIPDMLLLNNNDEIETPKYNGITTVEISEANALIRNRISKIVDNTYPWIKAQGKSINFFLGLALKLFPGFVKKKIINAADNKILKYLHDVFQPQSIKQWQLLVYYLPQIETNGQLYQKITKVSARIAKGGEMIESVVSVGSESRNIASNGDYIVKNNTVAGEEYIVPKVKFLARYQHDSGDFYIPNKTARVHALQITRENILRFNLAGLLPLLESPGKKFFIEAPWLESQHLQINDFLVSPIAKDELYRIARQEFGETYKPVS